MPQRGVWGGGVKPCNFIFSLYEARGQAVRAVCPRPVLNYQFSIYPPPPPKNFSSLRKNRFQFFVRYRAAKSASLFKTYKSRCSLITRPFRSLIRDEKGGVYDVESD
jgi:hypothetical protein